VSPSRVRSHAHGVRSTRPPIEVVFLAEEQGVCLGSRSADMGGSAAVSGRIPIRQIYNFADADADADRIRLGDELVCSTAGEIGQRAEEVQPTRLRPHGAAAERGRPSRITTSKTAQTSAIPTVGKVEDSRVVL
jgi:hypothetical protein